MIKCKDCGGRVLSERVYLSEIHLELSCVNCGRRWIFHHPSNRGEFAIWLHNLEMIHREQTTNH